jgi:hypothetical protein
MEGEDSATVLVRFDNGVIGTVVTSWAYEAAPGTEKFSAVGELGSLTSDGTTLTVKRRGEAEPTVVALEPVHQFGEELKHFARSVLDGTRPLHTQKEGIEVLGIILGAYEAARTGTVGFGRSADGFEVFYALRPEARGRGLVTAAVGALSAWLADQGERVVWLSTLDGNAASEAVADRCGFRRFRAGTHVDGRPLTVWVRRLGVGPGED